MPPTTISDTGQNGSLPALDAGPRPAFPGPKAMVSDIRQARAALRRLPLPPGENGFSIKRTWRARHDVLQLLLDSYYKHGPIFGMRILYDPQVFMIGPEANHFVLVSGRDNFVWRNGRFGDLITLLGDGLLTTDGDYHDTSRAVMMPSFHRDRVVAATETMIAEAEAAVERLEPGETIDLFHWTRELAMRIAMQALFGFDPDSARAGETAMHFEEGLAFHGAEFVAQLLVGPGTPYAKLVRSRAALESTVGDEIAARRASGEDRGDVLGSLLAAGDEDGRRLTDRQVLDHVMTLLFAGHDTTTSTITFLAYELARNPDWAPRLGAEVDAAIGEADRLRADQLFGDELPWLARAIDETLRLYPPAWVGPRRSVRDYEFAGVQVPEGLPVAYSSWVSHHLPDVWDTPEAFRPERFTPENRAKLQRGAYVPFGMGPRVCIGKRFGYTEVHVIAAALLRRFEFELPEGDAITIEQSPTLSPKGGLPVRLLART
jgi:cytochrome P450